MLYENGLKDLCTKFQVKIIISILVALGQNLNLQLIEEEGVVNHAPR